MQISRKTLVLQGLWFIWLLLLFIPIFFQINEIDLVFARQQFLNICHQKIERFFSISGHSPLVCSRCVGIYCGLFIFGFFKQKQALWLSIALILLPIGFDKILEHSRILPIGNAVRFSSGIVMGLGFSGLIWRMRKFRF